jgi:hypothetical protein
MADFRRLLYAFAVVAFLMSLTVPAYADFTCSGSSDNRPTRAESFNDLAGNIVLNCSGGNPTSPGSAIPPTTITVTSNTNITSRILVSISGSSTGGVTTQFNEALLIIDEPNTSPVAGGGNGHVMTNCGFSGEDSDPGAGPGVCSIIATNNAKLVYDGSEGVSTVGGNDFAACTASHFGCGRPNVFQGRNAVSLISGQFNVVQFVGVPLDPGGTTTNRVIRIANLRIDSTRFGVASPFSTVPVTGTVSFAGFLSVPDVTVQIATVQLGLTTTVYNGTGFLQCIGTDQEGGTGTWGKDSLGKDGVNNAASPFFSGSAGASPTGSPTPKGVAPNGAGMDIRIQENFSTAWKVRNVNLVLTNGVISGGIYICAAGACVIPAGGPNAGLWTGTDAVQNVPGVNYFTEAGFENSASNFTPGPNPPAGFGSPVLGLANVFQNGGGATNTGIRNAGVASQGTRISIQIGSIPNGARLFFPITVLLKDQSNAKVSGVMQANALTDQNGFTSFVSGAPAAFLVAAPTAFQFTGSGAGSPSTVVNPQWVEVTAQFPVITYEIEFARPDALEFADIVPAVVYNNNSLSTNLPQANVTTTATASFAPIQSGLPNANRPQLDGLYATPRFTSGFKTPADPLFTISKCACDLLFPWVVSAGSIDTGIVIANTSLDPCGGNTACTLPFTGPNQATPQTGAVTFYYFGTVGVGDHNAVANLAPNTSLLVPAGGYVAHVLSQNTTATNGLGSRTNFAGYVIAQADFQYCHGVVDITAGGGSVVFNYVGLQLDAFRLNRTNQVGENIAH